MTKEDMNGAISKGVGSFKETVCQAEDAVHLASKWTLLFCLDPTGAVGGREFWQSASGG